MTLRHFKAVEEAAKDESRIKIFFGGSIELGKAEDWQTKLADELATHDLSDRIDIYNPRRSGAWKTEWMNNYESGPFYDQVDWELRHQNDADLIVYYFAADTISPITLLELGLFHAQKPVIGADPKYLRIGNLMITKNHFGFDVNLGWDAFLAALKNRLDKLA